jgi:hypothetical protein
VLFCQQARGKEAIVAGFYHDGYEEPLLMLMKRRGVHSGLVVKVSTLPFKCYCTVRFFFLILKFQQLCTERGSSY